MKWKSRKIKDPVKQATRFHWMTALFMVLVMIIFCLSFIIGYNLLTF